MRLRVSTRVLLGSIVLVAGVLGAYRYWRDPLVQYRWHPDKTSLLRVLRHRFAAGDTLAQVEALLGPTRSATPSTEAFLRRCIAVDPRADPNTIQDGDEFRTIAVSQGEVVLQLRGGRLVNIGPSFVVYFDEVVKR